MTTVSETIVSDVRRPSRLAANPPAVEGPMADNPGGENPAAEAAAAQIAPVQIAPVQIAPVQSTPVEAAATEAPPTGAPMPHLPTAEAAWAAASPPAARAITRIEPRRGWASLNLRELWNYRELLFFLTWRDVTVRYKQTLLGAAWAIIQPVFTMLVFSLFFGRLAKIPSDGVPYPLFAFAALVPWTFFANALTQSSGSLVQSSNLLRKVYFPRLAIPFSSVAAGAVDFCIAFLVLLVMMFFYGVMPTWKILWIAPMAGLAFITSLAVGLWLSCLNVQYRDVRYVVPFLAQFWMFSTPIAYPSSLLEEPWRTVYGLNPMVGVVEGFRWALLNTDTAPGPIVLVSSLAAGALLVGGMFYFRRMERGFADVV